MISTGRNLLMIKAIMKRTRIQTAICANGSYIQYRFLSRSSG
ncbi:MAG: Cof-type HAD-IIB family hydrolase [Acetilactobacillus jinshanensis]